jgi:hypothetical protein
MRKLLDGKVSAASVRARPDRDRSCYRRRPPPPRPPPDECGAEGRETVELLGRLKLGALLGRLKLGAPLGRLKLGALRW